MEREKSQDINQEFTPPEQDLPNEEITLQEGEYSYLNEQEKPLEKKLVTVKYGSYEVQGLHPQVSKRLMERAARRADAERARQGLDRVPPANAGDSFNKATTI